MKDSGAGPIEPIPRATLAMLGDSVTTDHILPAGAILARQPSRGRVADRERRRAARLQLLHGSRRGNHEVMIRTFANVRSATGWSSARRLHATFPDGEEMTIYEAAMAYAEEGVPLVVLAGAEYGLGSSRDWAAKEPCCWVCAP